MSNIKNKIIIIAPFWGQPQHVGVYRVDRFLRWLSNNDNSIILILAGSADNVLTKSWGTEITIRDPLKIYRDVEIEQTAITPVRSPNRFRRFLAYALLNPDPTVVWAYRAVKHPLVLQHARGADFVLSSSPPESAHVAAALLARQLGAQLVVDMRDGWLDEPLKFLLRFKVQQWREGRLERQILEQATQIFVTSTIWKDLLEQRLSFTTGKVTVLTNALPLIPNKGNHGTNAILKKTSPLTLLHAGSLLGSDSRRKVDYLLQPLLTGLSTLNMIGKITFIGKLDAKETLELKKWGKEFLKIGWEIVCLPPVSRPEAFNMMRNADGLLLLSASEAAIPAKFFEYVCASRPIFAATKKGSAVFEFTKQIRQLFAIDYETMESCENVVSAFVENCQLSQINCDLPREFTEEWLAERFNGVIATLR